MFKSLAVLFLTVTFVLGHLSDDEINAMIQQVFAPDGTTTQAPSTSTNMPNTSVTVNKDGDNLDAVIQQIFGPKPINTTTTKTPTSYTTLKQEDKSVTVNKDGDNLDAVIQQIFEPKPINTTTTKTPTSCTTLKLEDADPPRCVTSDGKEGRCMQSYNCDSLHEEDIDHMAYCFIDNAATGTNDDPACDIYYSVICCPF